MTKKKAGPAPEAETVPAGEPVLQDATTIVDDMEADAVAAAEAAAADPNTDFSDAVTRAQILENEIEDMEQLVKNKKAELKVLQEQRLPSLMDQIGLDEIGLTVNNRRIRVALDYATFGSISKAPDFKEAVDYLEAHGFQGGVLTTVSVVFTEEHAEQAAQLMQSLQEDGLEPTLVADIHSSTLRSFVKDAFLANPAFDVKKVGVTLVRQARFTVR